MSLHSGIRASSSDRESTRKPVLKGAAGYGAWEIKMSTILEAEECWDLTQGLEEEPEEIDFSEDEDGTINDGTDPVEIKERLAEIKDWKRRFRKAASLITQSVDDSLVQMLSVHKKNPILIWAALASDFNTVTPAQRASAIHNFHGYVVTEEESFLTMKHNFNELLRRVTEQGGSVSASSQIQTLLGALPQKFDMLRESFFAQTPAPNISYLWSRMFDMESTQKKRAAQSEAAGLRAEVLYQTRGGGRGGSGSRGRGRTGGGGGRTGEIKDESCF